MFHIMNIKITLRLILQCIKFMCLCEFTVIFQIQQRDDSRVTDAVWLILITTSSFQSSLIET